MHFPRSILCHLPKEEHPLFMLLYVNMVVKPDPLSTSLTRNPTGLLLFLFYFF